MELLDVALAHLGVERANALESKALQGAEADTAHARAVAAYKDFLKLWQGADPNVPIYKAGKAEYARLRSTFYSREPLYHQSLPRVSDTTCVLPSRSHS
jgi:hypothetical protein